jgi:hypothetical protein
MNNIKISEPVVVGRSRPNETRWGHFQFPSLCRLPGGALMVTVSDAEDAGAVAFGAFWPAARLTFKKEVILMMKTRSSW